MRDEACFKTRGCCLFCRVLNASTNKRSGRISCHTNNRFERPTWIWMNWSCCCWTSHWMKRTKKSCCCLNCSFWMLFCGTLEISSPPVAPCLPLWSSHHWRCPPALWSHVWSVPDTLNQPQVASLRFVSAKQLNGRLLTGIVLVYSSINYQVDNWAFRAPFRCLESDCAVVFCSVSLPPPPSILAQDQLDKQCNVSSLHKTTCRCEETRRLSVLSNHTESFL